MHRSATEYRDLVRSLVDAHGKDQAMTMAVGQLEAMGDREMAIVDQFGLRDGQQLIDVGCGSGRLSRRAAKLPQLRYLGTDVSTDLLEHAEATTGRSDFRFAVVDGLSIPEESGVADMVVFFSVTTHLKAEEAYVYLEDAKRVLRPGGRIVMSFLDIRERQLGRLFTSMVAEAREGRASGPPNFFHSVDMIRFWAESLGMTCVDIVDGHDARLGVSERVLPIVGELRGPFAFGQSIAVLEKPA